jgi:nitrous oxidase accessory protein NosD
MLKPSVALFVACILLMSAASIHQVSAGSKTIIVPDNYPSITQAIASATAGDTIYVRNGVYNESYFEINKPLTIRGEDVRHTIVSITPTVESVYSAYFNRTYYYPGNAIIIDSDNVKISGLTINSTGGITGCADKMYLVSNSITLGKACSLTGSEINIERNTLNGDDWQVSGSNLTLTGNRVNAANHSISINASYCSIYGNDISGTLVIWGSVNTISHNSYDLMFIFYGDYNTVQGNSGEISLGNSDRSCSNNIVSGNLIKGPSVWGIWIGSTCRNNIFHDNYIIDEGYDPYGEDYNSAVCICNLNGGNGLNNTFYNNAFINNSANIKFYSEYHTGGNAWEFGGVGNYWSDYNGIDANGDCIGDTPYIINSENRDNHPLIAPFNKPQINIEPPAYDPPIDESMIPQTSIKPTIAPTSSPTQPVTSQNPTAEPAATTDSIGNLLAVPGLSAAVIVSIASVVTLVALIVVRRQEKSKTAK